jgi:hypothetical protein
VTTKTKNSDLKSKTEVSSESVETTSSRVRVGEADFMKRLTEKLTHFDASLVLEAAMRNAGVDRHEGLFRKEETKNICLELIKRGGPAYSVGAGIYKEVIGS